MFQSVALLAIQPALLLIEHDGKSPTVFLSQLGISPEILHHPMSEQRIPGDRLLQFWQKLAEFLDDDRVALRAAQMATPEGYDLLGYAMQACSNLRESINILTQFSRTLADSFEYRLIEPSPNSPRSGRGQLAELVCVKSAHYPPMHPLEAEFNLAIYHNLATLAVANKGWAPTAVRFSFPAPADYRVRYRGTFECDCWFEQIHDALVFDSQMLSLPMAKTLPSRVHELLLTQLQQARESMPVKEGAFAEKVRLWVSKNLLDRNLSVQRCAEAFSLTPRTLQRRLGRENKRFRDLLDHERAHASERLLQSTDMSATEIAFYLGYHDAAAFYKSFARNHDCTPNEFRRRLR